MLLIPISPNLADIKINKYVNVNTTKLNQQIHCAITVSNKFNINKNYFLRNKVGVQSELIQKGTKHENLKRLYWPPFREEKNRQIFDSKASPGQTVRMFSKVSFDSLIQEG